MHPRRQTLPNSSYSHVFFRTHNKQFLFKERHIKNRLLYLWAKYKHKYGIKIYEFIIMDNHCHLKVKARCTRQLGNFMRTVNSQIARFINYCSDRDSQAIRERYKSPLISCSRYGRKVMQYIWLNRYKATGSNPLKDPYCSASWRLNSDLYKYFAKNENDEALFEYLLDSDEDIYGDNPRRFVIDLLNEALGKLEEFDAKVFENSHTIGDNIAVKARTSILSAFRHEKNPWPSHWIHEN